MAYVALARQTIPFGTGKFWHDVATTASRSCREDEQVYRRADRIRFEAGRAGHARRGGMPQDGKQRQDVLQLTDEIRRAVALRGCAG
ncbi:putative isrso16-transposase orfa protein [Burkholderia pseudomallei MSHR7343]|nr:putative isrso16-transposase orfa protein [Burkholderia pseudomallei MSHR7343]